MVLDSIDSWPLSSFLLTSESHSVYCYSIICLYMLFYVQSIQRISSDKASNLPKRDVRFILLK